MPLPGDPPPGTSPELDEWGTNVDDTLTDHEARLDAIDAPGPFVPQSGATMIGDLVVPAETYGSSWNGSNEVPTKNDVYDKIEAVTAAIPLVRPAVNDYVTSPHTTRAAAVLAADRLYATPLWVRYPMTFDRIAVELAAEGGAGGTASLRLGVAAHNSTTARPGALLLDAGTVNGSTGAGNGVKTITISLSLDPGLYWLLGAAQGANAAVPTWRRITLPAYNLPDTGPELAVGVAWTRNSVSGAIPDPIAATALVTAAPLVWLRRSV